MKTRTKYPTHLKVAGKREALCGAYDITIGDQVLYGPGIVWARKTPTCTRCAAIRAAEIAERGERS